VCPEARKSRQLVLKLGKLNLKASFVRSGMEREDVKNQSTAINDLDIEHLLEAALLRWRELVVSDQECETGLKLCRKELPRLSCTDIGVGIWVPPLLPLCADNFCAGCARQAREFLKGVLRRPAVVLLTFNGDKKRTLLRRR
jgi:hypothetical protein